MRRPLPALAAIALVAGCSDDEKAAAAGGGERVDCALGAGAAFAPVCAVERSAGADGAQVLVVRHPDGAFRRLVVQPDGLATADGADPARVTASGQVLEVGVAADRYRIPFVVKPRAGG